MIATVRVLRVRAAGPGDVVRAARAVVAYVQGGQPSASEPLTTYYARAQTQGRSRGAAARLVGLGAEVSPVALERLLRGRHAVSGRPLLSAIGSAGRVPRRHTIDAGASSGDFLTLAQAAEVAGVGVSYLRRLVGRAAKACGDAPGVAAGACTSGPQPGNAATSSADGTGQGGSTADGVLAGVRGPKGEWLVRRGELERWCARRVPPAVVLGYDLVCAAPKSVSLLWAFGDEALRADVGAALDAAVDATIGYLERHAVFGRIREESRPALGLAVASYLHDVSRSDEAHLHVHNVIPNAVVVTTEAELPGGAGGWEWRAIDGEALLAEIKTAGYVGAAVLRHDLSARRAVDWLPARNGVAEIAGFPADLLAAFSTRHAEVVAEFAQLVAAGLEPSGATAEAAQRGSRAPKRVLADAQVDALQRDRLTAAGWTVNAVRQLAPATEKPVAEGAALAVAGVDAGAVGELFDELAGVFGLTARATTFTRRDVLQHVAAWSADRLGAEAIERLTDRFLADRRVVLLHDTSRRRRRHQPERLYTVEGLLATEDTLLTLCRQGQVSSGAAPRLLVDRDLLDAELAAATAPCTGSPISADGQAPADGQAAEDIPTGTAGGSLHGQTVPVTSSVSGVEGARAAAGVRLTDEQGELVRRLLTSGDLVRPAVGPAGTGKTEAMRVLTAILHTAGRTVLATAHGGRQAEELADRIGIPARVVTSWLTLLDHTDDPAAVWPPGSVLIVDEATQVPTRDAERLLRYATRTGTVVLLLGDPAQLGSVSAGGWFSHLVDHTPDIPALATVHRQAGPQMASVRAALAALRTDTAPATRAALARLADLGRIHLTDDAGALLDRAVSDWYAERRQALQAASGTSSRPEAGQARAEPSQAETGRPSASPVPLPRQRQAEPELPEPVSVSAVHGCEPSEAEPNAVSGSANSRPVQVPAPSTVVPSSGHRAGQVRREPGEAGPGQPLGVQMMAQYQRDVDLLNTAARALLTADGTLTGPALAVAGREFRAGDEVITLTQAGHTLIPVGRPDSAYIRTGTIGIITAIHTHDITAEQAVEVYFPSKGTVRVPWDYLTYRFEDGRDGGLAHAYAITAAKAQGATMDTARAVVPDDTTRAGLYVMLSRARTDLAAYLLRRDQLRDHDDDESWLPALEADPTDGDPLDQLAERLARSRDERLATDHDPHATTIHQLRRSHTLAQLTARRLGATPPSRDEPPPASPSASSPATASQPAATPTRRASAAASGAEGGTPAVSAARCWPFREPSQATPPATHALPATEPQAEPGSTTARPRPEPDADTARAEPTAGLPRQVLLRRAELAAEAAIHAAALADPPDALVARIGPRPAIGAGRAGWDDAVAALAIYHARHQPATPTHDLGPPPLTGPEPRGRDPWLRCRDEATRLAAAWAARLPERARSHFHHPGEAIPRGRAIAGLHALLDHGHRADRLAAALQATPVGDVRTGAAVLAHRVADLYDKAGLDPALYELPSPTTAQHEWTRAFQLLHAAEVNHLANQATEALVAERHTLNHQLHQPAAGAAATERGQIQARLDRLDAALDRQAHHAVHQAAHQPPGYLVGLLGPRPEGPASTAWDDAAYRVERYRHHTLGLPAGHPALPDDPDPTRHAFGPRPADPTAARTYDEALRPESALDPHLPL